MTAEGSPSVEPADAAYRRALHREVLGAVLVFVVIAILFAPDAVTGQGVFWHHDLRHHHLPWRAWAAQRWASGEVPWWAPGAGNGFPLLAEGEGGFLYLPTMLLFLLLPDGLALDWSVMGHQVLAALGLWAYLRAVGLRGVAPLVGGAAWAWSGFLVSHTLYLGMQNGAAWLGWGLFAVATRRWWLVAGVIGALGVAGHPQLAAFGGLGLFVHAMAVTSGSDRLRWIAAAAVGGVLAAPQLVATLELVQFSMRDGGVGDLFANVGRMPIQELVGAVFPAAFGFDRPADVAQTYYHRGAGYWGAGVNHWEMCFYLGIPTVILAVAGVRRSRGWAAAGVLATLLMLGGPLWALVRHLPGFDGFRFPARFAVWTTLAVAVLAAHGVVVLQRTNLRVYAWRVRAVAAAFFLATGVAYGALNVFEADIVAIGEAHFQAEVAREAALPPPPVDPGPLARAALPAPEPEDPAAIPGKVRHILADLRWSTSPGSPRVLVPLALLLLASFAGARPRAWLLLVVADLWTFGHDYHPRVDAAEVAAKPPWLGEGMTAAGGPRLTVLDRRIAPKLDTSLGSASLGLPWGTSDVFLPSPLLLLRNDAVLATAGLDIGEPGPAKARQYLTNIDVARRMALRWVATTHQLAGLVPLVRGPLNVYVDPGALPRARLVPCTRSAATVEEAFAKLQELPLTEAVVEGDASCREGAPVSADLEYSDLDVRTRVTGPGTLVLADTWYPRWQAAVDGLSTPILRADVLFRGVVVPDGEHEVRFWFDPGLPGVLLPLSGLLGLVVLGVALVDERRRNTFAR